MPDIIQLIESGKNIDAKKLVETKLYATAATLMDQKYRKVIAETFCKDLTEKMIRHKKKSSIQNPNVWRGHKPVNVSPVGMLIKTSQKYGFKHKGSGSDKGGKWHEFEHPTGHRITIHQGKTGPYFAHSSSKDGGWKHVGSGDNHKQLHNHLKKVFPSYQSSRRKTRKEELQKKFGTKLTEQVKTLTEATAARAMEPQTLFVGHTTPADLRFAKVDNTKHTEHPFHSNVISHGYEHAQTNGDKNISRHKYIHPGTGHGVVLTSHGNTHSWGGRMKERHQDIDHYLTKVHEAIDPESPSTHYHVADKDGEGAYTHSEVEEKYLGFDKLANKLGHKKGIHDPDALAASIGRKKYGKKGFSTHKHKGEKS